MSGCPNSTESGCRCPEHDPGLAVHAADAAAYERALEPLRGPVRLSVVTLGPNAEQPCTGTMTCGCPACAKATAHLARRGGIGSGPARQPWDPRPSRIRAA